MAVIIVLLLPFAFLVEGIRRLRQSGFRNWGVISVPISLWIALSVFVWNSGTLDEKLQETSWLLFANQMRGQFQVDDFIFVFERYYNDAFVVVCSVLYYDKPSGGLLITLFNGLTFIAILLNFSWIWFKTNGYRGAIWFASLLAVWPGTIFFTFHVSPDMLTLMLWTYGLSAVLRISEKDYFVQLTGLIALGILVLFRPSFSVVVSMFLCLMFLARRPTVPKVGLAMLMGSLVLVLGYSLAISQLGKSALDVSEAIQQNRFTTAVYSDIGASAGLAYKVSNLPIIARGVASIVLMPVLPMPFWITFEINPFYSVEAILLAISMYYFGKGAMQRIKKWDFDMLVIISMYLVINFGTGVLYGTSDPRFRWQTTPLVLYVVMCGVFTKTDRFSKAFGWWCALFYAAIYLLYIVIKHLL